jgi:hypothetical protein
MAEFAQFTSTQVFGTTFDLITRYWNIHRPIRFGRDIDLGMVDMPIPNPWELVLLASSGNKWLCMGIDPD